MIEVELEAEEPPRRGPRGAGAEAAADRLGAGAEEELADPAPGAGDVARRAAARVGEDERRVGPASHQPEDRDRLLRLDLQIPPRVLPVALDLLGHGSAEAEALGDGLAGELVQPVVQRGVEVPDRLEETQGDQGMRCGREGHVS